jgi:hypothetical protein
MVVVAAEIICHNIRGTRNDNLISLVGRRPWSSLLMLRISILRVAAVANMLLRIFLVVAAAAV